jgi:hypothetical protein
MPSTFSLRRVPAWCWILAAAAVYYIQLWPRVAIGYYVDDARYLVSALSLLKGRYVALYWAGAPPVNVPPPGLPILLAPFLKVISPISSSIKLVPTLLCLGSSYLMWRLFDSWAPRSRLMLLAAVAFHPLLVTYSGSVLSEPCLLFGSLLALFLFRRCLTEKSAKWAWALGCILAWASLIRYESIVLVVAIVVATLYMRRWRLLWPVLIVPALVWGAVAWRNTQMTGSSMYLNQVHSILPYAFGTQGGFPYLLSNGVQFVHALFVYGLAAFPIMRDSPAILYGGLIWSVLALAVVVFGLGREWRNRSPESAWRLAAVVFMLLYIAVHAVWLQFGPRYLLPIAPLLLGFFVEGLSVIAKRLPTGRRIYLGTLLLIGLFYIGMDGKLMSLAAHPAMRSSVPLDTYAWMRANLPPQTLVMAPNSEVIFLYTGHQGIRLSEVRQREDLLRQLQDKSVDFALYDARLKPLGFSHSDPRSDYTQQVARYNEWMTSWTPEFKAVHVNYSELTALYRVARQSTVTP